MKFFLKIKSWLSKFFSHYFKRNKIANIKADIEDRQDSEIKEPRMSPAKQVAPNKVNTKIDSIKLEPIEIEINHQLQEKNQIDDQTQTISEIIKAESEPKITPQVEFNNPITLLVPDKEIMSTDGDISAEERSQEKPYKRQDIEKIINKEERLKDFQNDNLIKTAIKPEIKKPGKKQINLGEKQKYKRRVSKSSEKVSVLLVEEKKEKDIDEKKKSNS